MKKMFSLLAAAALLTLCLAGCGTTETTEPETEDTTETTETTGETEVTNPVEASTPEGIMETLGFEFGVPEGAQEVSYNIIDGEVAEMNFRDEAGTAFTARIQDTPAEKDISGMYYAWTATEQSKIGYCSAEFRSYVAEVEGENSVQVILWYDTAPGIMYSISAEGPDLNGLDLTSYAQQVYIPTQGDVG